MYSRIWVFQNTVDTGKHLGTRLLIRRVYHRFLESTQELGSTFFEFTISSSNLLSIVDSSNL